MGFGGLERGRLMWQAGMGARAEWPGQGNGYSVPGAGFGGVRWRELQGLVALAHGSVG